jgi:hypothetical protein
MRPRIAKSILAIIVPAFIVYCIIVVASMMSIASGNKQNEPQPEDPLEVIDERLYRQRELISMQVRMSCMVDSVMGRQIEPSEYSSQGARQVIGQINRMKENTARECQLSRETATESMPIFERIVNTGTVGDYYFFDVLFPRGDGDFSIWPMGVFDSLSTCERTRSKAVEYGFPTRNCRRWPPDEADYF